MKLKLDENLGQVALTLFCQHGHEISTVPEQGLSSASDRTLIETCRAQQRCLVTLDLDFANPLLFRPSDYAGIAVLRLPSEPSHDDLIDAVVTLVAALRAKNIKGKLWIVQRGRIREYQEEGPMLRKPGAPPLTPKSRGCRSSTVRWSPIGDLHWLTETAEIPSVLTTTAAGSGLSSPRRARSLRCDGGRGFP